MNLKQMEYFVAIVNEGNISAAAKSLHISQPPLSAQMKLLEDELGVVLFERGSRSIFLTEAGKIFYEKENNCNAYGDLFIINAIFNIYFCIRYRYSSI